MKRLNLFVILFIAIENTNSARILGIFHTASRSHHIVGEVLFKALAKRGHEVVMVSAFPLRTPMTNYVDIFVNETRIDMEYKTKNNFFQNISSDYPYLLALKAVSECGYGHAKLLFENSGVQKLIQSASKFDLVILDVFFNDSHYIFGHIFNCPIILCSTFGSGPMVNNKIGTYTPYSYVPFKLMGLPDKMSFFQRTFNALLHLGADIYSYHYERSIHESILHEYFPNSPSLPELQKHIALILSNGNYLLETPIPTVPNMIEVGGYHVGEVKPLPKDIKAFLDNATEGVILFSLGSMFKAEFLNENVLKSIIKIFSRLPVKVLGKLDKPLDGRSENVVFFEWLPQNDVLAHPNIKLFITHSGLLSTIESIYHGIPTIGVPMFADQFFNALITEQFESGLRIKLSELGEEALFNAINEVLTNPKYTNRAKFRSDLLRNQPIKPMDKAIYWVEHVIKHKGAEHLANASMKLEWYEKCLLDVALLVVSALLVTLTIFYYVTKYIISFVLYVYKKYVKRQKVKIY